MKEILYLIPKVLVLFLTFILPLKFGSTTGIPEMPMSYWNNPLALVVAVWPVMLFPWFAASALLSTLLFEFRRSTEKRETPGCVVLYGILFFLMFLFSLTGWKSATVWDFPAQNTAYLMGMSCYVFALIRTCMAEQRFIRYLLWALIAGFVCSLYSAVNQYWSGFDDTIRYLQEKEKNSGVKILEGQFGNRLKEARVSGDFAICNVYGGYLVLIFPILLNMLYRLGSRITPPIPARAVLCIPPACLFLFILKETGSRGAILACAGGLLFTLVFLPIRKMYRIALFTIFSLSIAVGLPLIQLGRSFNSMKIRFDYFFAAFKMMFRNLLTGVGWGEFMNEYLILKNVVNDECPHSPHNLLLTLGSQCGLGAFLTAALLLLLPVAAGAFLMYKRIGTNRDPEISDPVKTDQTEIPIFGFFWGIFAWTLHSMVELNYETPGSFGVAAAVSIMILFQNEIRTLQWGSLFRNKFLSGTAPRIAGILFCMALCAATLIYSGVVIKAEWNYDRLHNRINFRFSDTNHSAPEMEEVRALLEKCDNRSPFPFAEVSAYCVSRGAYHIQDALFYLDKAIERSPERSAYYMRKYRILSAVYGENSPAAQTFLQKARTLSPKNPAYYPDGVTPYGKRSY